MAGNVIKVQLEGRSSDGGHVRFNEFLARLESLRQVLTAIEQDLVGQTKSHLVYRVVNLSHSSPASIELEAAAPPRVSADLPHQVVAQFFDGLEYLGDSPAVRPSDEMSFRVLEAYKGFVGAPRRELESFVVSNGRRAVTIDDAFEEKIEKIIGQGRTSVGSIAGALDSVNLHADANKFTIYPPAGPARVVCHFPRELFEQVVQGLGRHVSVKGSFKFLGKELIPSSMEVEELEVFPRDKDLPSLSALRGIAPQATGDKDSVAFVRALRDEGS